MRIQDLTASLAAQLFGSNPTAASRPGAIGAPKENATGSVGAELRKATTATPGAKRISAEELLRIYSFEVKQGESGYAEHQITLAKLRRAVQEGKTFEVVRGEVQLDGTILVPYGSNAPPEFALKSVYSSAEVGQATARRLVEGLEQAIGESFETNTGGYKSREEFEANLAEGVRELRSHLAERFGFRGGETVTGADGHKTLGAFTLSFSAESKDYNGRLYALSIAGAGGAGRSMSFELSGLDITA